MSENTPKKELGESAKVSLRTQQAPTYTFTHVERPFLNEHTASSASVAETKVSIEKTVTSTATAPTQPAQANPIPSAVPPVVTAAQAPTATPTPIPSSVPPIAQAAQAAAQAAAQTNQAVQQAATQTNSTEPRTPSSFGAERVIPNAGNNNTKSSENTETKAVKPMKNRRLWLVILLAILLGIVFLLLKPSAPKNLDELQQEQQGTSLPIEFRPVDEEEAKRAEEQAIQAAQAQAEQNAAAQTAPVAQTESQTNESATQPLQPLNATQTMSEPMPTAQQINQPAETQTAVTKLQTNSQAKPTAKASMPATNTASRPKTQNSVVYQPEREEKPTLRRLETERKAPARAPTSNQREVVKAPVAAAQPTPPAATSAPSSTAQAVSTKVLAVPKGVSLMQVFRNNNLNISDVNAMSKASGANGVLSNLTVGEKMTVRLDSHQRVTEMTLHRGGKFIRQANGTYIFRK